MNALGERLFRILSSTDFLQMRGLANELPIFIQPYEVAKEEELRRMVGGLTSRIRNHGIVVKNIDLLDIVLDELDAKGLLDELLQDEASYGRAAMLDTLQNLTNARDYLIPRLTAAINDGETQLTLITGSGRVYPFLRTHNILQSLEHAMVGHPVVIFFPGKYTQDPEEGSYLRLFGTGPGTALVTPHYRARNLDDYTL